MSNWLRDELEKTSVKYYTESQPQLVDGMRTLLRAGKKPAAIRKWVKSIAGNSITTSMVGHLIDYLNKEVNS